MKWNKVSEVGFPKLEEINTSGVFLCATENTFRGGFETIIMRYEKRLVRGKAVERWKWYYNDSIYIDPERIVAWAEIPVYDPKE